jgi:hypothetical protein
VYFSSLCFKVTILVAAAILLTVRNWASFSDRPLHVEYELRIVISTKVLSIAVLESF